MAVNEVITSRAYYEPSCCTVVEDIAGDEAFSIAQSIYPHFPYDKDFNISPLILEYRSEITKYSTSQKAKRCL
jgi:hypothetical protein